MSWEAPQALGGPVLKWELVRGTRLNWPRYLRNGYAAWLILQCLALFDAFDSPTRIERFERIPPSIAMLQKEFSDREDFLDNYVDLLLQQQLLLLVLLVPALAAGSLGQEK